MPILRGAVRTTTHTANSITPQDPYLINRIVGYSEYRTALENFDTLVKNASKEELLAIDEVIGSQDQLAVYTNVSRRFPHPRSPLDEGPDEPGDNFERRGLAWMMALARVEVAAMLAGFSDARQPFLAAGPTPYELPQYTEMVFDGLRAHYWALANDKDLARVLRTSVEEQRILAYSRRLVLARAFWQAAAQLGGESLAAEQQAEMRQWGNMLDGLQTALIARVQDLLAQNSFSRLRGFSKKLKN